MNLKDMDFAELSVDHVKLCQQMVEHNLKRLLYNLTMVFMAVGGSSWGAPLAILAFIYLLSIIDI